VGWNERTLLFVLLLSLLMLLPWLSLLLLLLLLCKLLVRSTPLGLSLLCEDQRCACDRHQARCHHKGRHGVKQNSRGHLLTNQTASA
jgi:hypothetical protein